MADMIDMNEMDRQKNQMLRKASGEVRDDRALAAFLYQLMRDYLSCGVVEKLVRENEGISLQCEVEFCNGFLARYAQHLADRLTLHE